MIALTCGLMPLVLRHALNMSVSFFRSLAISGNLSVTKAKSYKRKAILLVLLVAKRAILMS